MEENEQSKRDLSQKWIENNVYEALEKIEEHERRMKNGCSDLMEYIDNMNPNTIMEIQIKNMELMINELHILIENTHRFLQKQEYEKARDKLKEIKDKFRNGRKKEESKENIVIKYFDDRKKVKAMFLTPLFKELEEELSKLRSKMIDYLDYLLVLKSKPITGKEY